MSTREDELEAFKTRINLTEFVASEGYQIDRKASSRNSVCMKSGSDKVFIGMGLDGHWVYWSVHDQADNGTVIDFVQNRRRINLGEVRTLLRPWLDGLATSPTPLPRPDATAFVSRLEPVPRDLVGVRARLSAMRPVEGHHDYLVTERKLPAALLASDRFEGRIYIDDRGNAVFPHWNLDGVCGYEIKNKGFSGFAPGGVKGLWGSRKKEGDATLVIGEAAIDAISYLVLNATGGGGDTTRIVSTAGQMNPRQPALLRSAIDQMPPGSEIIAAVDHDEGGDAIADQVERVYKALRRTDIELKRHSPPTQGEDWNDVLRASMAKTELLPGCE